MLYFNNLRFNQALRSLDAENNKLSIADIAIQSGFNSRNSFYKVFKKKTGITLTLYRKYFKQGSHTETIE
ncbi:helix-turn-helix domain-containing protein [Teredinibacter franksiae]|uniref:helix-turn-helix domain-containing protein n=1 Tax=Teredinibacter franksiae TaxID=2761453 RepID=UPI0016232AA2